MDEQPHGPKGTERSVGTGILLAVVTLGVYCYVWTYKTHKEVKGYSDVGVGGGISACSSTSSSAS